MSVDKEKSKDKSKDNKPDTKDRSIFWKKEDEEILKDWGDKAQCYEWMHNKGYQYYKNKSIWYTIPVIIISTITGTANFAQDRFGDDNVKNYVVMGIGTLSIVAGIITTISQFLKINELNEGHRVATLSWGKFNRNIKTELTKHPLDRNSPDLIIKVSKDEYDRLIEVSPAIPKHIISLFNNLYGKDDTFIKPDICGHKFGTHIYSMSDTERQDMYNNIFISKKEKETITIKSKKDVENDNKVNQFKETYYNLNNRYPTEDEIKMIFQPIFEEAEENTIDKQFKMTIKPSNSKKKFSSRRYSVFDTDSDNSDTSDNTNKNIRTRSSSSSNISNKKSNIVSETIQLNNSDSDNETVANIKQKNNVKINENNNQTINDNTSNDYEYDTNYLSLNNNDEDPDNNTNDIVV